MLMSNTQEIPGKKIVEFYGVVSGSNGLVADSVTPIGLGPGLSITAIPEPGTAVLLALGLGTLALAGRRR